MDKIFLKLIRMYRHLRSRKYGWFGNYKNWNEAKQGCTGYDSVAILKKIKSSTLKVKTGEAVYERDGLLVERIEYSWPLLANLLHIAAINGNKLTVLDFGGSLGSSYFQNGKYLNHIDSLKWCVVEQKEFVTTGQSEIADDKLKFYYSPDEMMKEQGMPDVILISCVLPYLEKPYEWLKEIAGRNIPYLIIDNTYFNSKPGDRLTVQKVPPEVYYDASYPAWFLDYNKIKQTLAAQYEVTGEYENEQFLYFYGEKINYRGFIAKLR